MAEVYDFVPGMPGSTIRRTMENGDKKQSKANQLERVIALHEDVRNRLQQEGLAIHQRADFRLTARQQRTRMQLREDLDNANKSGDYKWIYKADQRLLKYDAMNTECRWSQADVDFHISLYRPDGREFFVEADSTEGDRGLEILQKSMTH